MKIAKRSLCVLLSVIMFLQLTSVASAGSKATPVVFVAGYTSSRMWLNRGTPDEKRVWKPDIEQKVVDAVKSELPGIIADAGGAVLGDCSALFSTLEPYVNEILEPLRMNDDGSSKYNVEVYPHAVEDTRLDQLKKIKYYPDYDSLVRIGAAAGDKNVYCCTLDWRLSQVDCARVLDEYIDGVLAATGADKVSLLGVSFGGQTVASYLSLYGGDKVSNVVLHSPALDGSSIVSELLSGKRFKIAWHDALELYEAYDKNETDFASLTNIVSPAFLDGFIYEFLNYFLIDFFLNFGSVWDLVPLDEYAALRDRLLRDGKHDAIIAKSDKYHFEIAANRAADFARLQAQGVDIAVIAGYGFNLAVEKGENSDGVIGLASTTGAVSAQPGESLGKKYVPASCGKSGHYHISGSNSVDAATGYIPERTWYVEGMLHGLGCLENKVSELMNTLLLTDEIRDVRSSAEYPQFMASQNRCRGVYCAFGSCAEGFVTPYSTGLTVTNLSETDSIVIDGIYSHGAKLTFGYSCETVLAPGESLTAKVCGKLPEDDLSSIKVQVNYVTLKEKYSVGRSRTQGFTYNSGSLYEEILTVKPDGNTPVMSETGAKKEGVVSPKVFFARLVYYLYKLLTFSVLDLTVNASA